MFRGLAEQAFAGGGSLVGCPAVNVSEWPWVARLNGNRRFFCLMNVRLKLPAERLWFFDATSGQDLGKEFNEAQ